jgi:hypothetical protein
VFIFDTNAFNSVIDDRDIPSSLLIGMEIFASYIQLNELKATKNTVRRAQLIECFTEVTTARISIETAVFPLMFGEQNFGDGTFEEIKHTLDQKAELLPNKKKRQKLASNANDALIGEVAEKNNYTLITDDNDFSEVMKNRDVAALTYSEFIEKLTNSGT